MCIKYKEIYNQYSNKTLFVPCGHCNSCLQEKANKRVGRIKNAQNPKFNRFFLTLTYENRYIPYIRREEFLSFLNEECDSFNIYRDGFLSESKLPKSKKVSLPLSTHVIRSVTLDDMELHGKAFDRQYQVGSSRKLRSLADTKSKTGVYSDGQKIGVVYYSDFQKFAKRLRQILKRNYQYNGILRFAACSEYGSKSLRPHFHAVFDTEKTLCFDLFKQAVASAWSYDNNRSRKCELSYNSATYLAAYVNSHSFVPGCLQNSGVFKTQISYSQGYGMEQPNFNYDTIVDMSSRVDFSYIRQSVRNGILESRNVSVPSYVIGRFFPYFKGVSRLDDASLFYVLSRPTKCDIMTALSEVSRKFDLRYTFEDLHVISTRIFNKKTGNTIGYAYDYIQVRNSYKAYNLRNSHKDVFKLEESYDNIATFLNESSNCDDSLKRLYSVPLSALDPNSFSFRVKNTQRLEELYAKMDKSKKVRNLIYSNIGAPL